MSNSTRLLTFCVEDWFCQARARADNASKVIRSGQSDRAQIKNNLNLISQVCNYANQKFRSFLTVLRRTTSYCASGDEASFDDLFVVNRKFSTGFSYKWVFVCFLFSHIFHPIHLFDCLVCAPRKIDKILTLSISFQITQTWQVTSKVFVADSLSWIHLSTCVPRAEPWTRRALQHREVYCQGLVWIGVSSDA